MTLKRIRVALSVIIFAVISFFFLDFAEIMPLQFHVLMQFQLVPAIIGFHVAIIAFLLVLTILFGRVYCSSICPLGVMQDIISWYENRRHKKRKYVYRKPRNLLRYAIVTISVVTFIAGFPLLLNLIDPYSIYGRIAGNILKPIYVAGNNLLALIVNAMGSYKLYLLPFVYSIGAFALSLGMFLFIGWMAYKFGRRYCNTICPVGTVLGFVSKFSVFRVMFRPECNACGLCEFNCKAECLDGENRKIDYSRCVSCFNCLKACKRSSIYYGFGWKKTTFAAPSKPRKKAQPQPVTAFSQTTIENKPLKSSRRFFFVTAISTIVIGIKSFADKKLSGKSKKSFIKQHAITPPGAIGLTHFQNKCTACHLCVSKCPANIITPAITEYGLAGFMQPTIKFENGFCNYDCTICTSVCPNHALQAISVEEKHALQVGKVNFILENCIVHSQNSNCGACAEHCPTGAVVMKPFGNPEDALTIPEIEPDYCVGCGACEYICPVRPFRAIYIDGNPVHQKALPPKQEKKTDIKVDDFGF